MDDTKRDETAGTTLDGYQTRAITTATYPGRGEDQIIYPAIAMCEEAGEVAGAVSLLLAGQKGTPGTTQNSVVAEATLALAASCGAIMGLIKKVYRNDPPGELTAERVAEIRVAIALTKHNLGALSDAIRFVTCVKFPSVPVSAADRKKLVDELGDLIWYAACISTEAGISLGDVGDANYAKLVDRAKRNVIRSTGNNR